MIIVFDTWPDLVGIEDPIRHDDLVYECVSNQGPLPPAEHQVLRGARRRMPRCRRRRRPWWWKLPQLTVSPCIDRASCMRALQLYPFLVSFLLCTAVGGPGAP